VPFFLERMQVDEVGSWARSHTAGILRGNRRPGWSGSRSCLCRARRPTSLSGDSRRFPESAGRGGRMAAPVGQGVL